MAWWPMHDPPAYWGTGYRDHYAAQEHAYPTPAQYISRLIQGKHACHWRNFARTQDARRPDRSALHARSQTHPQAIRVKRSISFWAIVSRQVKQRAIPTASTSLTRLRAMRAGARCATLPGPSKSATSPSFTISARHASSDGPLAFGDRPAALQTLAGQTQRPRGTTLPPPRRRERKRKRPTPNPTRSWAARASRKNAGGATYAGLPMSARHSRRRKPWLMTGAGDPWCGWQGWCWSARCSTSTCRASFVRRRQK